MAASFGTVTRHRKTGTSTIGNLHPPSLKGQNPRIIPAERADADRHDLCPANQLVGVAVVGTASLSGSPPRADDVGDAVGSGASDANFKVLGLALST